MVLIYDPFTCMEKNEFPKVDVWFAFHSCLTSSFQLVFDSCVERYKRVRAYVCVSCNCFIVCWSHAFNWLATNY